MLKNVAHNTSFWLVFVLLTTLVPVVLIFLNQFFYSGEENYLDEENSFYFIKLMQDSLRGGELLIVNLALLSGATESSVKLLLKRPSKIFALYPGLVFIFATIISAAYIMIKNTEKLNPEQIMIFSIICFMMTTVLNFSIYIADTIVSNVDIRIVDIEYVDKDVDS